MNLTVKMKIEACEEQLQQAMLKSDVSVLKQLLSPELVFTNHLGQLMTRQDDLDAHESGKLKINAISLSDQVIKVYDDMAVVSVQTHISGRFANEASEGDFRFTRVWRKTPGETWQLIAGHSSTVNNESA